MDKVEKLEREFNRRRGSQLRQLESALGVGYGDVEALQRTVGEGMKQGHARFIPPKKRDGSSLGEIEYKITEGDKTVTKRKEITDKNEAALFVSLQQKADRSKT